MFTSETLLELTSGDHSEGGIQPAPGPLDPDSLKTTSRTSILKTRQVYSVAC